MEPIKIILVDDDLEFGKLNCEALISLGYHVHFQTSLAGIDDAIVQFSPSIIVLDVEIGKENGIEKAKELIALFPSIPILFVSSHTDISLITEGIAAGALSYLKKPFDIKELEAYIKRFANRRKVSNGITLGNYLLDTETNLLSYNDAILGQLPPLEKNALILFFKSQNKPLSVELLSRNLWAREYGSDLNQNIHNLISRLRKYLNKDGQIRIDTIKSKGYQLTIL